MNDLIQEDKFLNTRKVLVEKANKTYRVIYYSAWRKLFKDGEKNSLLKAHGYKKITTNVRVDTVVRNTTNIIKTILMIHNIKNVNEVIYNPGTLYFTNGGPHRSIQIFYK